MTDLADQLRRRRDPRLGKCWLNQWGQPVPMMPGCNTGSSCTRSPRITDFERGVWWWPAIHYLCGSPTTGAKGPYRWGVCARNMKGDTVALGFLAERG